MTGRLYLIQYVVLAVLIMLNVLEMSVIKHLERYKLFECA